MMRMRLAARVLVCGAILLGAACGGGVGVVGTDSTDRDATTLDAAGEVLERRDSDSASDADATTEQALACHPKECTVSGCGCVADSECCSGACSQHFCMGILFCGSLQCDSPFEYCRTIEGADADNKFECQPVPSECIGSWTCDCVKAHAPCASLGAVVTCQADGLGRISVTCD